MYKLADSAKDAIALLIKEYFTNRNVEGSLFYLTDDVQWIGNSNSEIAMGKAEVEKILQLNLKAMPASVKIKVSDIVENTLSENISVVFYAIEMKCEDADDCFVSMRTSMVVRRVDKFYYICQLHSSVSNAMQDENEYFPMKFVRSLKSDDSTVHRIVQHSNLYFMEYDIENSLVYHGEHILKEFKIPPVLNNFPTSMIELGIIHKDCESVFLAMIESIKRGAESSSCDMQIKNKSGEFVWLRLNMSTMYSDDGRPVMAVGTAENLSGYKDLEYRYSLLARQAGISTWILDMKERAITHCQGDVFGAETSTIKNFPQSLIMSGCVHDEDVSKFIKLIDRVYDGEDNASGIVRYRHYGKKNWQWLNICYTLIDKQNGKPMRAFGTSTDVTDRVLLENRYKSELNYRENTSDKSLISSLKINLTMDRIEAIHSDMPESVIKKNKSVYSKLNCIMGTQIPSATQREEVLSLISQSNLMKLYNMGKYEIKHLYMRQICGQEIVWVELTIKLIKDPSSGDIMCFMYSTNVNEMMAAKKMIDGVVKVNYEFIAHLNINTNSSIMYAVNEQDDSLPPVNTKNFNDDMKEYYLKNLVKEDQEVMLTEVNTETIKKRLQNEKHYSLFYSVKNEDGSLSKKELQVFYSDEELGLVCLARADITAAFNAEEDKNKILRDALNAAEQANAAKSEFLSRISHEIRTPLNTIIGMASIAGDDIGNEAKIADCLSKIGISSKYLLSIINDILDMSRIESGKASLRVETIPFDEFLHDLNSICASQAIAKGIDYDCSIESGLDDYYAGDAAKLNQLLLNIISNGVKFTNVGGKVQVVIKQVGVSNSVATLKFTVIDTGCGISAEFMPRLFDPFARENWDTVSGYSGAGLGLAIANNLAKLMGGHIEVSSIEGVGSEFNITVRLGVLAKSKSRNIKKLNINTDTMKVLIVDDEVAVCERAMDIMSEIKINADWADSGRKAIAKVTKAYAEGQNYSFILVDLKMPDLDGIQTSRQIRQIVGEDVTIIIMTAYDWVDVEAEAKTAGVNFFMAKPIFKNSIISAIEKILNNNSREREEKKDSDFDFSGKRILLVEDHELNIEIARKLLLSKGAEVDVAMNGLKAIEMIMTKPYGYYDAILMDIRMPVMDGLTATKNIRMLDREDTKTVPIIAMTANAFESDMDKSKQVGMNAHLSKPIEPKVLFRTLNNFIGKA